MKQRLATASQEDVETKLMELCGYMGTFSSACMKTVQDQSTVSIENIVILFKLMI